MFLLAKLYNLEGSTSDHSPIFLLPNKPKLNTRKGIFRFENAWLLELMCFQVVMESWMQHGEVEIQHKIKKSSEKLELLGQDIMSNFSRRLKNAK